MENTTKEFQPFNEEWKKEMNKLPKQVLIAMLSDFGKEKSILKTQFEEMKTALTSMIHVAEIDDWKSSLTGRQMILKNAKELLASLTENNEKP